jgi:hypothetical protein
MGNLPRISGNLKNCVNTCPDAVRVPAPLPEKKPPLPVIVVNPVPELNVAPLTVIFRIILTLPVLKVCGVSKLIRMTRPLGNNDVISGGLLISGIDTVDSLVYV